jgi:hypothetical protein
VSKQLTHAQKLKVKSLKLTLTGSTRKKQKVNIPSTLCDMSECLRQHLIWQIRCIYLVEILAPHKHRCLKLAQTDKNVSTQLHDWPLCEIS